MRLWGNDMASQDYGRVEAHEPDCTCGCHDLEHDHSHDQVSAKGHGHEHHHAHGCGQGHHHDHAHDHGHDKELDIACAHVQLEAHTHEQASTVSATFTVREGAALPFTTILGMMSAIAPRVEGEGGVIGHIKAFGKTESAFAHASITSAEFPPSCGGDTSLSIRSADEAQIAVIALLIGLDELAKIVEESIVNAGEAGAER